MKNYYAILELNFGADPREIRTAFRRLVKQHHPDVSELPNAQERFLEIQEAYEFLMDDHLRSTYNQQWNRSYIDRQEQFRREQIYRLWAEHYQRKQASARAAGAAVQREKAPEKQHPAWSWLNKSFNVFFLILFVLIIVLPVYRYFHQDQLPVEYRRPFQYFILPILLGSVFLVGGYYFWFIRKTDDY